LHGNRRFFKSCFLESGKLSKQGHLMRVTGFCVVTEFKTSQNK